MQEKTMHKGIKGVTTFLAVFIAVIVIVGIGVMLFFGRKTPSPSETVLPLKEQALQDSKTGLPAGISYEFAAPSSEKEGKVSQDQIKNIKLPIPNLSRPFPDSILTSTKTEMEQLVSELENTPYNATLWSELGLYRKEAGDYEGARLAWEFAYELQPENAVIAENLGVLYGYYLRDGSKSEEFFRVAILLEPKNIHLRLRLFELYRDVFKDKAKERAAIEEALKDNSDNQQLAALLKEL